MADDITKTQYEIMRMAVLTGYLHHPAAFNEAYVFAWFHRMHPLGLASENEHAFEPAVSIRIFDVGMVLATVKQLELAGKFDDLCQTTIGTRMPRVSGDHIHPILSYLNLTGDLSEGVVNALERHINSTQLARRFSPDDVHFPS